MQARDLIIDIDQIETPEVSKYNYSERPAPEFTITVENDSDIAIRKVTKCTKKLLVIMLSQALIYVKDEKTDSITNVVDEKQIRSFFGKYFNEVPALTKLKYSIITPNWRDENRVSDFLRFAIWHKDDAQILVRAQIYNPDTSALDVLKSHNTKYLLKLKDVALKLHTNIGCVDRFLKCCEEKEYDVNLDKLMYNLDKLRPIKYISNIFNVNNWNRNFFDCLEFCDFNRLIDYIVDDIINYQRLEIEYGFRFSDYYDYLNMQNQMYGYVKDKYPENFLSDKAKLIYKFNLWKRAKDDEIFEEALAASIAIEYKPEKSKYCVIAPKNANDVIEEGQMMHHCVASYVNSIKDQKTRVLFIRDVNNLDESLVTIEVTYNNTLIQARCICNTDPNEELTRFIIEYAKAFKLDLSYCNSSTYTEYIKEITKKMELEKEQTKEQNKNDKKEK